MSAARKPTTGRNITLTMTGFAAVWYLDQQAALAARPADATAPCACCLTLYSVKGLAPLISDAAYQQAIQVHQFPRDGLVCKFCQDDFAVEEAVCACCDETWMTSHLAPVDTDYTYDKAARYECSFERDDLVCEDCRASFENTYGRDADDCFDLYSRGHDRND